MSRKFFILVNPRAGREKVAKITREISSFLESKSCDFEIFETKPDLRGTATVRDNLDPSHSDLAVVGGDGTINEAVNGLQADIPVSFIPAGSGDDFVKNIDIGERLSDHLETAFYGEVRSIDIGDCNGRKLLNGVGVGFDGQIVADMQERSVPLLSGQAKYYYHVLHILSSYRHRSYQLQMDGRNTTEKLILLTIANGTTFGGGFMLTPDAKIDDGLLDVCTIGRISGFKRYLNILRLQNGSHGVLKAVNFHKVKEIEIAANDQLEGHIDGEYLGKPPFKIRVLPKSLMIRARPISS